MSETPETDEIMRNVDECMNKLATPANKLVVLTKVERLERQRDEAVRLREEEIAEFNAGCDAYKNGVRFADLEVGPHDQTGIGYAWAAFDDLRKQRDEAVATLKEIGRYLGYIQCPCSPKERNSGHRIDCYVPELESTMEKCGQFLATLDRTEKT
jgi:hypothetical protein